MAEYTFKVNLGGISDKDSFKDASRDELKVLVAIISLNETAVTPEQLADIAGVSCARVKAAIALFEESGVISSSDFLLREVEYEFGDCMDKKPDKKELAKSIRDNDLYEMNTEMEKILEKTLEVREIERITSLYTKKGLSPEYILTLSSYLKDKKQNLTVEAIVREANKLAERGTDTLEELEVYISEKAKEIAGEMEMRRLFGIYGRTLTRSERDYFKRWLQEYGYSSVIIGEAYDIAVAATNKISLPYINSILATWHGAECKTLEECRAQVDIRKHKNDKKANNSSQKSKKKAETDVPKYADFNSEDALMRAIERSYGTTDEG